MDFWEQYKHPKWQKKRLECLEDAGWECQDCGAKEQELHVHHPRYIKGRMVWEYEVGDLAVLCETCHKAAHALLDEIKYELATSDQATKEIVLGVLRSYNNCYPGDSIRITSYEVALGVGFLYDLTAEEVIALSQNEFVSVTALSGESERKRNA